MNRLLDSEEEELPETSAAAGTEISLGTGTLLGIFFALALLCGGFFYFGFRSGYTAGHSSTQGDSGIAQVAANGVYSVGKPAPGRTNLVPAPAAATGKSAAPSTVTLPYTPPDSSTPTPVAPRETETSAAAVASTKAEPAAAATASPAVPGVSYMVQIAAVSHQEDADMLVSALKGRGYAVAIHTEPQDKFMHVQVGPFATRKDADAMRNKLLADGFNAIVK
jgi:cell division septation protein DedD